MDGFDSLFRFLLFFFNIRFFEVFNAEWLIFDSLNFSFLQAFAEVLKDFWMHECVVRQARHIQFSVLSDELLKQEADVLALVVATVFQQEPRVIEKDAVFAIVVGE